MTFRETDTLKDKLLGRIAFDSRRNGTEQIYLILADGSQMKRLTNGPRTDCLPSWSPDGKQIAFVSNRDGPYEIYLMNADGPDLRRVTFDYRTSLGPAWSPDGKQIAYSSTRDGHAEIYVINADGSNQRRVTNTPDANPLTTNRNPAFSPDGGHIAFSSSRGGWPDIYLTSLDGSQLKRLTKIGLNCDYPRWSPDGRQIVFLATGLVIVNPDNLEKYQLTDDPFDGAACWSPDGKYLAFGKHIDMDLDVNPPNPGHEELFVIDLQTRAQARLTFDGADNMSPSWTTES